MEQLSAGSGTERVQAPPESALEFVGAHEANASTQERLEFLGWRVYE